MLLGLPSSFASTLSGYISGILVPVLCVVLTAGYAKAQRHQNVRDNEINTISVSLTEVTKGLAVLIERVDPVVNNVAKIDTAVNELRTATAILKDRIERMPNGERMPPA